MLEVVAIRAGLLRQTDACRCVEGLVDGRSALALLRSGRLVRGVAGSEEEIEIVSRSGSRDGGRPPGPGSAARRTTVGLALSSRRRATPIPKCLAPLPAVRERRRRRAATSPRRPPAPPMRSRSNARRSYTGSHWRCLRSTRVRSGGYAWRWVTPWPTRADGAEAARSYLEAAEGATVAECSNCAAGLRSSTSSADISTRALRPCRSVLGAVGMRLPATPHGRSCHSCGGAPCLRLRGTRLPAPRLARDLRGRIDPNRRLLVGGDRPQRRRHDPRGRLSVQMPVAGLAARRAARESPDRWRWRRPTARLTGCVRHRRTARVLAAADELARQVDDPYPLGMVALAHGAAFYLECDWKEAHAHCDRACDIFRRRCTGVHWERNTATAFGLWALSHMGEIAELDRRWPRLLAEARDRGDLYAVMNLSTYLLSIVRLAADEPDLARDEVGQAMAHWSRGGYHIQHNDQAWGMAQIELYAGRGGAAWDLIAWNWPALSRSLLLRVQFVRVAMWQLRARCAGGGGVFQRA